MTAVPTTSLEPPERPARHDHMVRRFSTDRSLLVRLGTIGVLESGAAVLVAAVCVNLDVPAPGVTLHGRRGPHTGYYQSPRHRAAAISGTGAVRSWERDRGRPWPLYGMIRLGRIAAADTIAHELGHHLVQHLEPAGVANHGKLWVAHFDEAARAVAVVLGG